MAYAIEVHKRDMSDSLEECAWKDKEGHNPEGTGPDCDEMCKSTDGDPREIGDWSTESHEYEPDDHAEDYGSPVEWAVSLLGNRIPVAASFPDLYKSGSAHNGRRPERDWLSGNDKHPYEDKYTEYSVYLRGDWTKEDRYQVFEKAGI